MPATQTRGLVQRIATDRRKRLEIEIGPSPTNTKLFFIVLYDSSSQPTPLSKDPTELAYRVSMTTALWGALFARREVIVIHDVGKQDILELQV
jgi:hypothetical protein